MVTMNHEAVEFEIARLQGCCKSYRERIAEIEAGKDQATELIRTLFWIAFVWNDHNFTVKPEQAAKDICAQHGVTSVDSANAFLEALKGDSDSKLP